MVHVIDVCLSLSIPTLVLIHLFAAPYTKVEESFNIQAVHDILTFGIPSPYEIGAIDFIRNNYDHVEFPGSVPRTFVGAAVLSGLARPWLGFLTSPEQVQLLVRVILGLVTALALVRFRKAVDVAYGRTAGRFYLALMAAQFHVLFYASRTLPNMLAFPLTTEAFRSLLLSLSSSPKLRLSSRRRRLALYLLTVAGIVFRSEIALLLLTTVAMLYSLSAVSIRAELIPAVTAGGIVALIATLLLDTLLWRPRIALNYNYHGSDILVPVWPELQAFFYNTVSGHASDWGTSPWHYYMTSALPKLLLNPVAIPLIFGSMYIPTLRRTSLALLVPALSFVILYSILPHKEARFIIYTIPPLTAIAAGTASYIFTRRSKIASYRVLSLLILASLPSSLLVSTLLLSLSAQNYPGAHALALLHKQTTPLTSSNPWMEAYANRALRLEGVVNVHIDNLAAQTGVTRFQELRRDKGWRYDKTENATLLHSPLFWKDMDFVITESPETVIGAWDVAGSVEGFGGIGLRLGPEELGVPGAASGKAERGAKKGAKIVFVPPLLGLLSKSTEMKLEAMVGGIARTVAGRFTRGYWPHIRMKTSLYILMQGIMPR